MRLLYHYVPEKKHFLFFLNLSVDKREHQCYY
nr:MAG TPA: hypothetical protein [Caudoviricetes sp.]